MKIIDIQAAGLRGCTPEGGWAREIHPKDCVHTLVAVYTDEGITGWGSAYTNEGLVRASLATLEPLYLGENPLEPQRVTASLEAHTWWMGRGGAITHTISGIDIALWDILGKATQQPVSRLLGGRYRERALPYASILMRGAEPLADELAAIRSKGFRAFKIGWGPFGRHGYAYDEAIVRAARAAVGPDSCLIVDAGASDAFWRQDYKWAMRTARMLADYDIYWFEEPLPPDDLDNYVRLRQVSPVRIAGGEVMTRWQAFEPWLRAGALDIVQPDVTKVGGISTALRIARIAEQQGVRFVPHGWNTALGLVADLHLVSACSNSEMVEYIHGSPYVDEIVEQKWELDSEGMLPVPSRPGLGITLDLDALEKYTGERFDAFTEKAPGSKNY